MTIRQKRILHTENICPKFRKERWVDGKKGGGGRMLEYTEFLQVDHQTKTDFAHREHLSEAFRKRNGWMRGGVGG